jgi:hypothetical protein
LFFTLLEKKSTSLDILGGMELRALNVFGAARNDPRVNSHNPQKSVCFTEIPLQYSARIARRKSAFGLGFTKFFIRDRGGQPVWYVEKGSDQEMALNALIATSPHHLSQLAPFIDIRGNHNGKRYEFDWEREWRVNGDLRFNPQDVAFLMLPENYHDLARNFFEDARHEQTGPAYLHCPYIDPFWDEAKILQVANQIK